MKLRKLFIAFLCLCSTVSIVGIGYSAWYFVDNMKGVQATNSKIGVVLNDIQHLGHFTRSEFPTYAILEEGASSTDLYDGINFYSLDDDNEYAMNDSVNIEFVFDPNLISYPNIDVSLRLKVSLSNNIANYIEFYPGIISDDDNWVDFSYFGDRYTSINNVHSLNIDLTDYFKYVDLDKKPNTKEKYTALYQDLLNSESSVVFEIEVYIVE